MYLWDKQSNVDIFTHALSRQYFLPHFYYHPPERRKLLTLQSSAFSKVYLPFRNDYIWIKWLENTVSYVFLSSNEMVDVNVRLMRTPEITWSYAKSQTESFYFIWPSMICFFLINTFSLEKTKIDTHI